MSSLNHCKDSTELFPMHVKSARFICELKCICVFMFACPCVSLLSPQSALVYCDISLCSNGTGRPNYVFKCVIKSDRNWWFAHTTHSWLETQIMSDTMPNMAIYCRNNEGIGTRMEVLDSHVGAQARAYASTICILFSLVI